MSPSDAVVPPRAAETEMRVWTPEEVQRFLAFVAEDPLSAMWRLFFVTKDVARRDPGLRRIDVDLPMGRIAVQHARCSVRPGRGLAAEDSEITACAGAGSSHDPRVDTTSSTPGRRAHTAR